MFHTMQEEPSGAELRRMQKGQNMEQGMGTIASKERAIQAAASRQTPLIAAVC